MWVKAMKWMILIALALGMVYGVYTLGEHAGSSRVTSEWNQSKVELNRRITDLQAAAREREQRHAEEVANITDNLYTELNNVKEERDSTIADLRNDNRMLRDRFRPRTCPSTETTSGQPGGNEAGQSGLSDQDAEFLIRFAGEADDVAQRLIACQAILNLERAEYVE